MKSIIILSLLISMITNLAYAQTDSFRIHLKINDPQNQINDGQRIDITATGFANEGRTMLAEGHIYGDSVILTGHVSHPTVTMIAIETESPRSFRSYKILLENTDYHVTMSWVPGSGFEVITDSRFHNLWSSVISSNREFEDEKRVWIGEHARFIQLGRQQEADSILHLIDGIESRKILFQKAMGYQNPDNHATAYIIGGQNMVYDADHLAIYEALSNEVKNSVYGKTWKAKLDMMGETPADLSPAMDTKSPLVGQFLPGFQGRTGSGDTVIIDQAYFGSQPQHKITLIEFWASWCTPCRIANTKLYPLYFKYKDRGFHVISFSLDTNEKRWIAAQQHDNLPWLDISDLLGPKSPVPTAYNIRTIPTNVLVDSQGVIIAVNVYDSKILEGFLNK